MAFKKKPSRFEEPQARIARPHPPAAAVLRYVLLAAAAILGAAWALQYHYGYPRAPLVVPIPSAHPAPTFDADAGETPIPDFDLGDAG